MLFRSRAGRTHAVLNTYEAMPGTFTTRPDMQFPAAHWVHLRTTNPIEAAFAPAKGRARKTKGAGSRRAGLAMAFKLIESSQQRWRKINAPHLVGQVRAGRRFPDGREERPTRREEALIAA